MYRNNMIQISPSAIQHNIKAIQATLHPHTIIMAVVKADGYGHGLIPTANAALAAGAAFLGVALIQEGIMLREAGIKASILVLGPSSSEGMAAAIAHDLTQTLCSPETLIMLNDACIAQNKKANMHIKIDTGMGRIGIQSPNELLSMLDIIEQSPYLNLTGAYTHFADADGEDISYTQSQYQSFLSYKAMIDKCIPDKIIYHTSNSAATLRFPEMQMDMVRLGIAMYGASPVSTQVKLEPALQWHTEVSFIKDISPGDSISYGCTFRAIKPMRIATIALGYGDGYLRACSNRGMVLINNCFAPIVGRVCMDQTMVDISHIPNVLLGDKVTLIGRQGQHCITANMLGEYAGTISYEVLLAPTNRVAKQYI